MNNYRQFAVSLALQAGHIMRQNFTTGMTKEWKQDNSPLTITDLAINDLVLNEVGKNFPDHGILAEEGSCFNNEEYVWVCDPVDGTNPFSHGYPLFTFSLALTRNGYPILGVLYDPILDRLVTAESGQGAYLNGHTKIKVNESPEFNRSIIALEADMTKFRSELLKKKCLVATFVCITYASLLVAIGEFRAAVWCGNSPWDGAAVQIIIEEAGGICTDISGFKQRYDRSVNGIIASNKQIHSILVEMIKSSIAST